MSYMGNSKIELGLFNFTHSGNLAANDYLTLNTLENNISSSSVTSQTLNLPPGSYLIQTCVAADRTTISDFMSWQIEKDGTLLGSTGTMDDNTNARQGVDIAVCEFFDSTSSSIKIKITTCTASAWTANQSYGYLLIIRSL